MQKQIYKQIKKQPAKLFIFVTTINPAKDNSDIQAILRQYLKNCRVKKIIEF
ncbi:MAG: hypothetical protein ACOXZV_11490 [Bacteroidales bacterium]|jgi:hypothetical protein